MALGNAPNEPTMSPTPHTHSASKQPVVAPSVAPITMPTQPPTLSSGWMYASTYTDIDCTGTLFKVVGQPIGVCEPLYDPSGNSPVLFTMFSCSQGANSEIVFIFILCDLISFFYLLLCCYCFFKKWSLSDPSTRVLIVQPTLRLQRKSLSWAALLFHKTFTINLNPSGQLVSTVRQVQLFLFQMHQLLSHSE